ncbi:PTS sugar transporter subunit IIB [Anaerorhabdus sp.]|jgi:cellobiose PTS system EIIB component|uniref:PTS sugar transporter subunit IIB n=1 Tax=Anaerorhabdus sp. TaxID=1872524 RepID=UPI002FC6AF79
MKKVNVLLACQNGMSTGIMKKKIQDEAIKNDVDLNIQAVGIDEIKKEASKYDLVLLAPQVRYAEKAIAKEINGIAKHMVIDSVDFGKMDGASVFHKFMIMLED